MNPKMIKSIMIYLIIIVPVGMFCMYHLITGNVTITYHGYGVDSSGNLYVGLEREIAVYDGDSKISSIQTAASTARAYYFTVQHDDTILLSTASNVYVLDLNGNILSKTEDTNTVVYDRLQWSGKNFTATDGTQYVRCASLGRMRIETSDGNVIYQMPMFDFVVKIITCLWLLSMAIFIPIIVKQK